MDLVQKEYERLSKKPKTPQSIENVQSTIDLLQSARDTIAVGLSHRLTVSRLIDPI